jgi:predicted component of type VI protein secretion system
VIIDFLRYGSLERAQTVSLEDHLLVLQFHAQQDPEVLLHVAERLAAKVEDPAKLPLVRDLLEGIEPKEVARRHEVKLNQVYAARTRLRELLEDISFELPLNP